eukprot:3614135-Rhodomonas_salina.3
MPSQRTWETRPERDTVRSGFKAVSTCGSGQPALLHLVLAVVSELYSPCSLPRLPQAQSLLSPSCSFAALAHWHPLHRLLLHPKPKPPPFRDPLLLTHPTLGVGE